MGFIFWLRLYFLRNIFCELGTCKIMKYLCISSFRLYFARSRLYFTDYVLHAYVGSCELYIVGWEFQIEGCAFWYKLFLVFWKLRVLWLGVARLVAGFSLHLSYRILHVAYCGFNFVSCKLWIIVFFIEWKIVHEICPLFKSIRQGWINLWLKLKT